MNPELRRNLWLELTTHRVVAMPVVLVLVFALFISMQRGEWPDALYTTSIWMFVLLVHFWGARQSSEAVTEEVGDRTWDWQRLSALTPWEMAWGKLAGATAFTWYGAAICLAALAIGASNGAGRGGGHAVAFALTLVASGIALHGMLLAASLQAARKASRLAYRLGSALLIPGLLAVAAYLVSARDGEMGGATWWYGALLETNRFVAASAVAFAAWAVLAAYRQMCAELRRRTLPWAWPAFALFLAAYLAGFAPRRVDAAGVLVLVGVFTAIALSYYALFTDDVTAMSLRRLMAHARARRWRRLAEEMPLAATTLVLAIAFACAAPWAVAQFPMGRSYEVIAAYPIACVLFLVRDAGLLCFFLLGPKPRRVEGVTLLYIVLLAWVIPGLLRAVGLTPLATAIMPIGAIDGWQAALVVAGHVVVVWTAVGWRWRRAFGSAAKV